MSINAAGSNRSKRLQIDTPHGEKREWMNEARGSMQQGRVRIG